MSDHKIFVWELKDGSIRYIVGPYKDDEVDIESAVDAYNILNNNELDDATRLPDMTLEDLPLDKADIKYWRWDASKKKIVVSDKVVNDHRWEKIRRYRDYLLQQSDGLASSLVLKKLAGDDSTQLTKEISQLNKYT